MTAKAVARLDRLLIRVLRLVAGEKVPTTLDDIMAALMAEAIGADPRKLKEAKRVARVALEVHAKAAKQARRVMYRAEQANQEFDALLKAARARRQAKAQARWAGKTADRLKDIGGSKVELTPKFQRRVDAGPSPGGYDPKKDLAAGLPGKTEKEIAGQRKAVSGLTAPRLKGDAPGDPRPRDLDERGLGTINVKIAKGVVRTVSLKSLWNGARDASPRARELMDQVDTFMKTVDGLRRQSVDLLQQAQLAKEAGRVREAAKLNQSASRLATEADRLRSMAAARGRSAYNLVRSGFWRRVNDDKALVHTIKTEFGLQFRENTLGDAIVTRGAPHFPAGPDGRVEGMTLEHFNRVSDEPRSALDPRILYLSPSTENTQLNEMIRALSDLMN